MNCALFGGNSAAAELLHLLSMLVVLQSSEQVDKHSSEKPVVVVPLLWRSAQDNRQSLADKTISLD